MDLTEAAQRIFKRHWALILLFTLIGLSVPFALDKIQGTSYIGTARVNLGADPHGGQDSTSLGDTGQGLATSPSVLAAALKQAKVNRSVDDMLANNAVTVTPVGTSGVLDVSVTDTDAHASAAIANALANRIVLMRDQAEFGAGRQLLASLQGQANGLTQQIAAVVKQAKAVDFNVPGLQAEQSDLSAQRAAIDAQLQQLSQDIATSPHPQVIDASQQTGTAAQSGLTVLLALGGLLGLLAGVAVAATVEAARPTLTAESMGRRLGAPVLGRVPRPSRGVSVLDPWLATYVGVAAEQAGVSLVQLVPVGRRPVDVTSLAQALDSHIDAASVVALSLPSGHRTAAPPATAEGTRAGIIVVSHPTVKGRFLAGLERHLQVTKRPVLGVITYRGRMQRVVTSRTAATETPATIPVQVTPEAITQTTTAP